MLCTVAIPTRQRYDKVRNCIRSVFRSATGAYRNFEILLRVHRSDREMISRLGDLEASLEPGQHFRVIFGDDLYGYRSLPDFYHELIEAALGNWVWHLNDDMQVFAPAEGPGWDEALEDAIGDGRCLIHPEHHKLNESLYHKHETGPAPCHGRTALGEILLRDRRVDVDIAVYDHLVKAMGWPVRFMRGIGIFHDWGGITSHVDDHFRP